MRHEPTLKELPKRNWPCKIKRLGVKTRLTDRVPKLQQINQKEAHENDFQPPANNTRLSVVHYYQSAFCTMDIFPPGESA
jgi:hypothetical protein